MLVNENPTGERKESGDNLLKRKVLAGCISLLPLLALRGTCKVSISNTCYPCLSWVSLVTQLKESRSHNSKSSEKFIAGELRPNLSSPDHRNHRELGIWATLLHQFRVNSEWMGKFPLICIMRYYCLEHTLHFPSVFPQCPPWTLGLLTFLV